jgi:hypothetical protein
MTKTVFFILLEAKVSRKKSWGVLHMFFPAMLLILGGGNCGKKH